MADALQLRAAIPFCGIPFVSPGTISAATVAAVIGGGHSLGNAHDGAENGPFFLRTLSKAHTWSAEQPAVLGLRDGGEPITGVVDLGDIQFDGMSLMEALDAIESVVRDLPAHVAPCLIGGDHTVTLPVVRALRARRPRPFTVVQFDHHLDLQIWGAGAGLPTSARESIFNTNVMSHVVDEIGAGRLVQIGVDPYATVEAGSVAAVRDYLASVGRQVCLTAPALTDRRALQEIVGRDVDVYVTVDVDVLQRHEMSATGYPADIGLGSRELLRLIDVVLEGNRLIGFDVVEFAAPRSARDPKTLADGGRAVAITLHLLSWLTRQNRPHPAARRPECDDIPVTRAPEARR